MTSHSNRATRSVHSRANGNPGLADTHRLLFGFLLSRGRTAAVTALLVLCWQAAGAKAEDVQTFYAGKTIKLLVGLPPGGGADAYARLVQRHLGRYVPGAPAIVAQNMPGAGSLRSVMALNSSPED